MYNSTEQRDFARHLRKNMTDAERRMWQLLQCRQLNGFKFRRQAAIGKYIVDFVCFNSKLVIELDGGQHNDPSTKEYDTARTEWLRMQGFQVLRFWNHDVLNSTDSVTEAIWSALLPPSPTLPAEGRELE